MTSISTGAFTRLDKPFLTNDPSCAKLSPSPRICDALMQRAYSA